MNYLDKIGDPRTLFRYLLYTLLIYIMIVVLFIFTMGEELKIYFVILLAMLVFFTVCIIFYIPRTFGKIKDKNPEENKNNSLKEKIE